MRGGISGDEVGDKRRHIVGSGPLHPMSGIDLDTSEIRCEPVHVPSQRRPYISVAHRNDELHGKRGARTARYMLRMEDIGSVEAESVHCIARAEFR